MSEIKEIESQIEALLDRIVEASSASVVGAYEKRIDKLEREKLLLADKAAQSVPPPGRLEEVIERALAFLSNLWTIYEKGSFALKRTVLKLAFVEPLRYNRFEGYRTAETTFPFKVLADFYNNRCGMVEPRGGAILFAFVQRIQLVTHGHGVSTAQLSVALEPACLLQGIEGQIMERDVDRFPPVASLLKNCAPHRALGWRPRLEAPTPRSGGR